MNTTNHLEYRGVPNTLIKGRKKLAGFPPEGWAWDPGYLPGFPDDVHLRSVSRASDGLTIPLYVSGTQETHARFLPLFLETVKEWEYWEATKRSWILPCGPEQPDEPAPATPLPNVDMEKRVVTFTSLKDIYLEVQP